MQYPTPADEAVTRRMRANRKRDTRPEVKLRGLLHGRGLRFRKNHPLRIAGRIIRPDVVFPTQRLAVFLDGCFWHCCPDHGNVPRRNTAYWGPKLAGNVERDRLVDAALVEAGWIVLRAWEHEPPAEVADRIQLAVRSLA